MKLTPKTKKTSDEYYFDVTVDYGTDSSLQHEIKITFINGEFDRADFPFRNTYTQEEWQVLKSIAEKIEEIAESYEKGPDDYKRAPNRP